MIEILTGAKSLCIVYAIIKVLAFSANFGALSAKFNFSRSNITSSPLKNKRDEKRKVKLESFAVNLFAKDKTWVGDEEEEEEEERVRSDVNVP